MEEKRKLRFLDRLKIAIFKLDEYGVFIEEKLSISIKYIIIIMLFSSLILGLSANISISREIDKGLNYFKNEFPNFYFENTHLVLERYEEGYDEKYDIKIIADTSEVSNDKINEYIKKTKDVSTAIIVLNDKIIYRNYNLQKEYTYKYLNSAFNLKDSNKTELLEQFDSMGGKKAIIIIGTIISFFALLIGNFLEYLSYIIIVSMVAIIVGRVCGISMKYPVAVTLSIYSLTVPILCSLIYGVVYNFTGFEIKHFNIMFLLIAYVYIIAAVLIIKTDLMKMSQDLMRIKSVEEQIKDELEKRKLEEQAQKDKEEADKDSTKEDNKKDKPESNVDKPDAEPDGSEV